MASVDSAALRIEVAYALAERQVLIPLHLPPHSTVEEAILRSKIVEQFPEIDLSSAKVGIFGKLSKLTAVLRDGDRIEIYRPLLADPKALRKQRAAAGKRMGKGGGDL